MIASIVSSFLLFCNPSWGMTPPDGWISLGDGHAIQTEGDPKKGELLELINVAPKTVDLVFALMDTSHEVVSSNEEENGDLTLAFKDDRLGVARVVEGRWLVLIYGTSEKLKLDKILSSVVFTSNDNPWGADLKEEEGWAPASTDQWVVDSQLVGSWVCTAMIKGRPMKLKISFDLDGSVVWEETHGGESVVSKGKWLASNDKISVEYEDRTMFIVFDMFQGGLQIRYNQNNLTLNRL